MDIFSRLKEYITMSGMPTTQFADFAQIPRPTLSQILNGRNRKISNEIIAKLHTAFPKLNVMWLMFGDGEPELDENTPVSEPQNSPETATPDLFNIDTKEDTPRQRTIDFLAEDDQSVEPDYAGPGKGANQATQTDRQAYQAPRQANEQTQRGQPQGNVWPTPLQSLAGQFTPAQSQALLTKKIQSVLVFFEDSTYQVFTPSQA